MEEEEEEEKEMAKVGSNGKRIEKTLKNRHNIKKKQKITLPYPLHTYNARESLFLKKTVQYPLHTHKCKREFILLSLMCHPLTLPLHLGILRLEISEIFGDLCLGFNL